MAFTQEEYNALKSAYAQGVLTVEFSDKKVTYRSKSEMKSLLLEMENELGVKPYWNGRRTTSFSSGL